MGKLLFKGEEIDSLSKYRVLPLVKKINTCIGTLHGTLWFIVVISCRQNLEAQERTRRFGWEYTRIELCNLVVKSQGSSL